MEQDHTIIRFKETNVQEFMNSFAEVNAAKQTAVDELHEPDLIDHLTTPLHEFTDAVYRRINKSVILQTLLQPEINMQLPSVQLTPVL